MAKKRSGRRRWDLLVVVIVTIAGAVGVAGIGKAAPADARLTGCTDTFFLVDGDPDELRKAVPERYTLGGEIPVGAHLFSISSACRGIQIGDGPSRRGVVDFVGVNVNPPDGSVREAEGQNLYTHNYLLWIATSDRGLSDVLASKGFPAHHVPGTRHTFTPGLATRHGLLEVPLSNSPYRIASAETSVAVPPHSHRVFWMYHNGTHVQQVTVQMAVSTENVADCGVTTKAGSRLSTLLGATKKSSPCFLQSGTSAPLDF